MIRKFGPNLRQVTGSLHRSLPHELLSRIRKPPHEVAPTDLARFSSCEREVSHVTLTLELDLDSVEVKLYVQVN